MPGASIGRSGSYKYLNAGPGATGGLYVNRRHWGTAPGLAGWWGYTRRASSTWSTPGRARPRLEHGRSRRRRSLPRRRCAARSLFHEAGIDALRAKSLAQTDYLAQLLEATG